MDEVAYQWLCEQDGPLGFTFACGLAKLLAGCRGNAAVCDGGLTLC